MLALGSLSAIKAVAAAAGADTAAEKRQIVAAVRQAIGLPAEEQTQTAPTTTTGVVIPVSEAAARLGKSVSTVKWYVASGQLAAVRTGRTRRLAGITAAEIDAFIARNTARRQPEAQPA